ncbi:MAG: phosphoribosylformylglycinamidine synthase subunit PurS [Helicobacteraceae bacterium]|jgi:phosphoribosylformylglycinamidine synthase|nr:phosphoribosylformylglycinamidine synthase subunit PurS [Helicobacteraceae bacterium]
MKVILNVSLKEGILDPQGKATKHALETLGFAGVNDVRIGKQIVMSLAAANAAEARAAADKMAKELLVNGVIEDYEVVLQ